MYDMHTRTFKTHIKNMQNTYKQPYKNHVKAL